jgi:hypothetical protein
MSLYPKRPWLPADDQRLRELCRTPGQTYRTMSKALRRSESSISNRMYLMDLRMPKENRGLPKVRLKDILLNGEPLQFAETDRPCARCAVRESVHHEHGCGDFAAEIRVRLQ